MPVVRGNRHLPVPASAALTLGLRLIRLRRVIAALAPSSGPGEPWLTVNDFVAQLGIPRSTFYKWRAKGDAPRFVRLPNGDLRTKQSWIDEWQAQLPAA